MRLNETENLAHDSHSPFTPIICYSLPVNCENRRRRSSREIVMNAMHKTALALLLGFAVQVNAQPLQPPPTAAELREWGRARECVDAGRHAGIDYARLVDRAIAGDPASLAALFRFTDSGWCDGAAGEGHSAILFGLLQHWGDRPFSRVLRVQKKPIRKAVFGEISAFPGWKPAAYPLTNASARQ
jgi:hypothetical protein